MSNYYLILVWIAVVWFLSKTVRCQRLETINGKTEYRFTPGWAFVVFLPLVLWAGTRGYVGDTYAYMGAFEAMPEVLGEIPTYMQEVTKDKGFYFLSAVIKCVIGNRMKLYFVIIAFIQVYFLMKVYRKYSINYVVSFFLFIVSTDYISWMFNGMRQFVAVSITLFAFDFILQKKYFKAIIVVVIASLFHQSALLLIPFVFIVQGKAWNKKTLLFIMGVILIISFVGEFTGILDTMLEETQYKNVVSDWQEWEDDGTNVIRVIVYSIPTILSLIGLRFIKSENDSVINICTNMSIISAGFYVVSMFTSGVFIGRLPIYFSLYNYILLPWEIENMFTKQSSRLVYFAMIGAYFVFYFYQIVLGWGLV